MALNYMCQNISINSVASANYPSDIIFVKLKEIFSHTKKSKILFGSLCDEQNSNI